jgi:hypothetical protein
MLEILKHFKPSRLFRSEESQFLLFTGLKMSGISLVAMLLLAYIIYTLTRLNFIFFQAHGYEGLQEFQDFFFQQITVSVFETLPYVFLFHILTFFIGIYIGQMILRPFKAIGDYCEKVIQQPDLSYKIDAMADFRLLTRFSDLFFDHLRTCRKKGQMMTKDIPPQFLGIHKPQFDWQFFTHFFMLMMIIVIISVFVIMNMALDVHETTTSLAIRILKGNQAVISNFLSQQSFIISEMWVLTTLLITTLHIVLSLHLYQQVAGAAFGIFATMRSYLKGNYHNRVHLIGFSQVRESTRFLNKYLDWLQKNISFKSGQD